MKDKSQSTVETGVDQLIEFLKGKGKIDLDKATKELGVPEEVIQTWVDFLVEDKVLGIEYKFTKPYIYLLEKKKAADDKSLTGYKKTFKEKAKKKEATGSKVDYAWQKHLVEVIEKKRRFFFEEAKKRDLKNSEELWEEYKKKALEQ